MKKKISTRNFIFISIILVIAMVFSVFKMPIAFSDYIFNGFARSFNFGLDYADSVSATFNVESANYYKGSEENLTQNAQNIIQDLVLDIYKDGEVEVVGEDKIKITVPGDTISNRVVLGQLEMKSEAGEESDTFINGSHIKKVSYMMNGTAHGVYIEFNKEGKTQFENLTSSAASGGKTIYVYLNKNYEGGRQISGIEEKMTDGVCYITLGSKEDAKTYTDQLNNSIHGINLTIDGDAITNTSRANTFQKVMSAVVVGIALIGISLFFILKFKEMGWVMSLALFIYAVLNIITLSLIPAFVMNYGTLITSLVGLLLVAYTLYYVVDKSQKEFFNGKKLPVSFKSGYKKSIVPVVDIYAITAIIGLISLFVAKGTIYCAGLGLLIGAVFGISTTLLLLRGFMIMYLHINPSRGNKINFVKGENIDEI